MLPIIPFLANAIREVYFDVQQSANKMVNLELTDYTIPRTYL